MRFFERNWLSKARNTIARAHKHAEGHARRQAKNLTLSDTQRTGFFEHAENLSRIGTDIVHAIGAIRKATSDHERNRIIRKYAPLETLEKLEKELREAQQHFLDVSHREMNRSEEKLKRDILHDSAGLPSHPAFITDIIARIEHLEKNPPPQAAHHDIQSLIADYHALEQAIKEQEAFEEDLIRHIDEDNDADLRRTAHSHSEHERIHGTIETLKHIRSHLKRFLEEHHIKH